MTSLPEIKRLALIDLSCDMPFSCIEPEDLLELLADAARYRWLRQYSVEVFPLSGSLASLDLQIDTAMSGEATP